MLGFGRIKNGAVVLTPSIGAHPPPGTFSCLCPSRQHCINFVMSMISAPEHARDNARVAMSSGVATSCVLLLLLPRRESVGGDSSNGAAGSAIK